MPEFSESQLYTASMSCFFQGNEYVLADAAYPAKSYILPALKKPHLQPYQPLDQQFNLLHSHLEGDTLYWGEEQRLHNVPQCCFILHNLSLDDEQAYWEEKVGNKFRKNYGPRTSPFVVDEERFFFFDNKDEGARIDIGLANSSSTRDYDASTFLENGRDKQARLREHDVLQSASFRRGLTLK
ncbi:hypothetical protein MUCCIDRAFT_109582 [Mucor lusitanicus CBS 277.49]|uniref:DDE Tnp4 domain-containing protein n=1 Tax=Mucor lusitanicus CBS 277.49 TaxID=747725 RepID=A0A168KTE6_MUCCL|nr:hypothetical protein MUCCIDRAFT_109582 [Mucor lusitanicus CBS 277.49]